MSHSRSRLHLPDLPKVVDLIGRDLLAAFAQAFVHADRLTTLLNVVALNHAQNGQESVAHERDLSTVLWFMVGTLWEARSSVDELRRAGVQRHLADPAPYLELQTLVNRWSRDDRIRRLRNRAAFHVDTETLRKGVDHLATQPDSKVLIEWDGPASTDVRLSFGQAALVAGLELDDDEFREHMSTLFDGHSQFGGLVQALLVAVIGYHNQPVE